MQNMHDASALEPIWPGVIPYVDAMSGPNLTRTTSLVSTECSPSLPVKLGLLSSLASGQELTRFLIPIKPTMLSLLPWALRRGFDHGIQPQKKSVHCEAAYKPITRLSRG